MIKTAFAAAAAAVAFAAPGAALAGGESDPVLSGKVYGSVAATESLDIYGELSFAGGVDDADNGYGTKVGVTWSF